jgi:NADP-dependent 3-hydroxy acid dehydrogenase YdfG
MACTNDKNSQTTVLSMSFTKNMTEEKQKQQEKIAVVTGTSTGIGYETSLGLARNGFITYATMRNLDKAENIKSVATKEKLLYALNNSML